MTTPRIEKLVEEFENLKCVNYAMYFGCVEEVCDCGEEKCANRQTVEMAEKEYKDWLRTALTEAHQAGIDEAVEIDSSLEAVKTDRQCNDEQENVEAPAVLKEEERNEGHGEDFRNAREVLPSPLRLDCGECRREQKDAPEGEQEVDCSAAG